MRLLFVVLVVAGLAVIAPPSYAQPGFCGPVSYASIWTAYQESPPPPPPITLRQARQQSDKYEKQALSIMKREGRTRLARDYRISTSPSSGSIAKRMAGLRAVARSSKEIERLCGFPPYDSDFWWDRYPYPPADRTFR